MNENVSACRLCGGMASFLWRQLVLGTHGVAYFRCEACDLIQTERPYWLEEAYSSALSVLDTGVVFRNLSCARSALTIAALLGLPATAPCLDFGAGHGLFVRMMRDRGLDFYWRDPHAENIFARGFESRPRQLFTLITAFEVFEHFSEPAAEVEELFSSGADFLLVGTLLHKNDPSTWWYYAFDTGQHVSFYSARTMRYIAKKYGYRLVCRRKATLFIKAGARVGAIRRALIGCVLFSQRLALVGAPIVRLCRRYPSRVWRDHRALKDALPRTSPSNRRSA